MINDSKMQKSVDLATITQVKWLVNACSNFMIIVQETNTTHERPSSRPLVPSTDLSRLRSRSHHNYYRQWWRTAQNIPTTKSKYKSKPSGSQKSITKVRNHLQVKLDGSTTRWKNKHFPIFSFDLAEAKSPKQKEPWSRRILGLDIDQFGQYKRLIKFRSKICHIKKSNRMPNFKGS